MKQLLCFLVLFTVLLNFSNAQSSITFSGEDNLGGYVRLHHVVVSNLSQQWCDTLYYPDTMLLLSGVGVEEHVSDPDFQISRVRPNPMNGTTELTVQIPYEDDVVMEVLDMRGSVLLTYRGHLEVGEHLFRVNLCTLQAYLLVVKTRKESTSVKLLNVGHGGGNRIEHCGAGPLHRQIKSSRNGIHPYELGDQMRYVGFLNIDSTEVVSDTIEKFIGVDALETLRFALWERAPFTGQFSDTVPLFIPDGLPCNGSCSVTKSFNVSGYGAGEIVQDVADIRFLRLKMEHSYASDLWIALSCPNGQRATVLRKYGTPSTNSCAQQIPTTEWGWSSVAGVPKIYFGNCNKSDNTSDKCNPAVNPMGVCWNYCWSNDTAHGISYACGESLVYEQCNHINIGTGDTVNRYVDSSDVANFSNFYHPDESFSALVGCPLNGLWQVTVIDGWSSDNGYLQEAEIALPVTIDSIDIPIQVPGVCLHPVTEITNVSAMLSASLTNTVAVETYGFCWGTSPAPTTDDFCETMQASPQNPDFSCSLSGLIPGTTYYVRAFAVTSQGVFYSMSERMFSTTPIPLVSTAPVIKTSDSTALSGGEVSADGGLPIISRGVCWSTSSQPDISNQHTNDGTGTGVFSSAISGLSTDSVYYVRAYATNSYGTAYGEPMVFRPILPTGDAQPCAGAETVTDYDGNVYVTVKIGNQCWMRENLKTTHFSDGTPVPVSQQATSWTVAYSYYPHAQSSTANTYGLLYNWSAAMNGASSSGTNPSGVQGVCPSGWHLPSYNEWRQLASYISGNPAYLCDTVPGVLSARNGKALADVTGWNTSDEYCVVGNEQSQNNSTGFSARPAGYLDVTYDNSHSSYQMFHEGAAFWSSTQFIESGTYAVRAYIAGLLHNLDYLMLNENAHAFYNVAELKNCALSVRCVKD